MRRDRQELGHGSAAKRTSFGESLVMDFVSTIGYLSGISFIQPHLDAITLIRTAIVIHLLDALLCYIIATQSGRSRTIWTLAGLVLGVWAVGTLFFVVEKGSDQSENLRS